VPASEATASERPQSKVQIVECNEGLFAKPSKETVDLIENAFKFKRQRFRQTVIAAVTSFITILLVIAWTVSLSQVVAERGNVIAVGRELEGARKQFDDQVKKTGKEVARTKQVTKAFEGADDLRRNTERQLKQSRAGSRVTIPSN
jgi:hypothetical protein